MVACAVPDFSQVVTCQTREGLLTEQQTHQRTPRHGAVRAAFGYVKICCASGTLGAVRWVGERCRHRVPGHRAKRDCGKAMSGRGGLADGLARPSRPRKASPLGPGVSCIGLATKPNSVSSGGNAFSPLACVCKIHTYTCINIYVCICFNVTANFKHERYFKLGIVLPFINVYETGLLKLLWSVAREFLGFFFVCLLLNHVL